MSKLETVEVNRRWEAPQMLATVGDLLVQGQEGGVNLGPRKAVANDIM